MALPNTYKKLQYLHSNSGAYIMLPYYPTGSTNFKARIKIDSVGGWLYGSRVNYRDRAYAVSLDFNGEGGYNFLNYGGDYFTPSQIFSTSEFIEYEQRGATYLKNGVQVCSYGNQSFTCAYKLILFGCYDGGSVSATRNSSFAYCKIYDSYGGNLLYDLQPAKRISDSVCGMYDLVNDVFYTNSGGGYFDGVEVCEVTTSVNPVGSGTVTGGGEYEAGDLVSLTATKNSGYKFVDWLLKNYTQLEYIQSNGAQWINTLLKTGNGFKLQTKIRFSSLPSGYHLLFGNQNNMGGGSNWLCTLDGVFRTSMGGNPVSTGLSANTSTDYEIEYNSISGAKYVKINGTTYTNGGTGAMNNYDLALFCNLDDGTTPNYYSYYRAEYFKVWDSNGNLVRDLIPVIRHSDGAIGLLDLVNLKFYGNSGSGTFIGSGGIGEENIHYEDNPLSFIIADDVSIQANFKRVGGKKYIIAS